MRGVAPLGGEFGIPAPVAGFRSGAVVFRERSDIGCVLLTAAVDIAAEASLASEVVQVDLPRTSGAVTAGRGRTALWLSPRSWLIHCDIADEMRLVSQLNTAFPDKSLHAVGFSDALCWFELSGEPSSELLQEGGFLSLERGGLPVGHAKRTLIAQIAAVVVRERESVWLVGVERTRARYFAEWISGAAL